jgi:hypothetical protein
MRTANSTATGLRVSASAGSRKAADLAAGRFYDNQRISLPALGAPLVARARTDVGVACRQYALCVHDQSPLHYTHHHAKKDRQVMYSRDDLGYDMASALLLSDHDGAPLAVPYVALAAADGVHSTRRDEPLKPRPWVDEVNRTMGYLEQQEFACPLVHLIDRECDKLLHLRRFARCGRLILMRANDVRRVQHQGQSRLLSEVEATLKDDFQYARQIQYKGQKAWQYVAETSVVLTQPARRVRQRNGKTEQRNLPGAPLTLRLVVAQVRDKAGCVLATWRLWTNLPPAIDAATVALWYYWRWRIESFHKLLKRAGQHVEQWQQETVERSARRLLIAAQACVIVWALEQSEDVQSQALRALLVRLSGRQMAPGVAATTPALLSGCWNLLAIQDALDEYSVPELRQYAGLLNAMLGLPLSSDRGTEIVKELVR